MHQIVVAIDLAHLTVERLDTLDLVVAVADVGDAQARHGPAGADDEGAAEAVAVGRILDAPDHGRRIRVARRRRGRGLCRCHRPRCRLRCQDGRLRAQRGPAQAGDRQGPQRALA